MTEIKWQPIETAPKGGKFLINNPGAKTVFIKMSFGVRPTPGMFLARQGFTILDDRGYPTKATKWHPLPDYEE